MNKFNAKKTEYNGNVYDSKKEADFARDLDLLIRAREVLGYKTQVDYPVFINNKKVFSYKLDFEITDKDGRVRLVDIKGYKKGSAYQIFKLKRKCVEAYYGVKIDEE